MPDHDWGERLEAFVVLRGDASESELIDFVRAKLADYKRPRKIHFVELLPRTVTGKVLKRDLKAKAAAAG